MSGSTIGGRRRDEPAADMPPHGLWATQIGFPPEACFNQPLELKD